VATSKSPAVQAAVIAKHMIGESKSQIAEDLGMSRVTVNHILSDSEIANMIAEGKSSIVRLIPKSIKAFERAIDKGKTPEAETILRSTGVFAPEQPNVSATVNLGIFGDRG
jgi:predicted transcriptional regulator